ncbi:MAG: glycosyltransferase [Chlorobiaceae bacterium]|nr:glycosyltransferase [Chlorobiaceae bacterium]
MRPLRIALISPFPPLKGGIARFSNRLQKAFDESGTEVIPVPFLRLYPRWLTKGRQATEPGAHFSPHPRFLLDLMNPFSWLVTARQIRRLQPDVLLVAYWSGILAPLCALMRRATGLKTVVLLHNFTSHESIPGESLLKSMLMASADGFILLSRNVEKELAAFSPSARRLTLFHPVYDRQGPSPAMGDARRSMALPEASKVLLFFGYVREYKGLDQLLEAMAVVIREMPSVRLVVAGEFFIDPSVFREQANRLGVAASVDFHVGYVPTEQVATLMAAADAVVLPYRSATQSGIVPLAFGHGVPVIACDAGALAEQVEHGRTGWIVDGQGSEALAGGILDFFRQADHLSLERNIEEACRRMSWSAFAGQAAGFLEGFSLGAA